jgi:Fe-S cluster biogenesis protein NfuA
VEADFPRRMQQIEALVQELERASDPRHRERAQALTRALLDLHKAGLARILEVIAASADGGRIVDELAADDLIASVLELHDLHPVALDERVRRAIEDVQTRAAKHGGDVVLLENREGRARIRIAAGAGCGSSVDGIRQMVEEALCAGAPDLTQLEFDVADPPSAHAFVSLQQLKSNRAPVGVQSR